MAYKWTITIIRIAVLGISYWLLHAYALEASDSEKCLVLLKAAQKCRSDHDCQIVFAGGCAPCECYTAVNKQASIAEIKRLNKRLNKDIVCETCNSQAPMAQCIQNKCVEQYDNAVAELPAPKRDVNNSIRRVSMTNRRKYGQVDVQAFSEFKNPQMVKISNLPIGSGNTPISTEEPFITRGGHFLFFNTSQSENNKDLHYAKWDKRKRWLYQGEIGPEINNQKEVQGNPTMDRQNNFYYVDSGVKSMVRYGKFNVDHGRVRDIQNLKGIPNREVKLVVQKVKGNMGVEVSADGQTLYFSRAVWDMNGFKLGQFLDSDILFLTRQGNKYEFDRDKVDYIMQNINTDDMEYAASISASQLELFFTRLPIRYLKSGRIRSRIMHATRDDKTKPFRKANIISAIGVDDFVEGPAISANGTELYYHKRVGSKFRLFKVAR